MNLEVWIERRTKELKKELRIEQEKPFDEQDGLLIINGVLLIKALREQQRRIQNRQAQRELYRKSKMES
jgi:hypothetical protein